MGVDCGCGRGDCPMCRYLNGAGPEFRVHEIMTTANALGVGKKKPEVPKKSRKIKKK